MRERKSLQTSSMSARSALRQRLAQPAAASNARISRHATMRNMNNKKSRSGRPKSERRLGLAVLVGGRRSSSGRHALWQAPPPSPKRPRGGETAGSGTGGTGAVLRVASRSSGAAVAGRTGPVRRVASGSCTTTDRCPRSSGGSRAARSDRLENRWPSDTAVSDRAPARARRLVAGPVGHDAGSGGGGGASEWPLRVAASWPPDTVAGPRASRRARPRATRDPNGRRLHRISSRSGDA